MDSAGGARVRATGAHLTPSGSASRRTSAMVVRGRAFSEQLKHLNGPAPASARYRASNLEHPETQRLRASTTLLLALALALTETSSARSDSAETVGVGAAFTCAETRGFHDGDTFACRPAGQTGNGADGAVVVVRVAGLDAPETGQAHWRPARDRLRQLAGPGTEVRCYKQDRYTRQVCRVHSPSGQDVVEVLLREGWAWHSVAYLSEQSADERSRYANAESSARAEKVGLWKEPDPQAPWDCRRSKERRQACR